MRAARRAYSHVKSARPVDQGGGGQDVPSRITPDTAPSARPRRRHGLVAHPNAFGGREVELSEPRTLVNAKMLGPVLMWLIETNPYASGDRYDGGPKLRGNRRLAPK
jgi:hypothetical protein